MLSKCETHKRSGGNMSIVQFDPINDFRQFSQVMDRLFGSEATQRMNQPTAFMLPIDVFEQGDWLYVRAALPGVDPDQIEITVEGSVMTIKGEQTENEEFRDAKVYRREYRFGSFTRSIRLPEDFDGAKVEAEFENGMVMIRVPRREEAKPSVVKVQVKNRADKPEA